MKKNDEQRNEKYMSSHLRSLGFLYPDTEMQLKYFNDLYANYDYELAVNKNAIKKVLERITVKLPLIQKKAKENKNIYFKRVVLAAEIASQLYTEPTFGHVKFQKIVYLSEQVANLKLSERYSKQAAGPYDRIYMHTIDKQLERQKWFKVRQEGIYKKYCYTPLEKLANYKTYYNRYYSKSLDRIQWIIETFRKEKTDRVELIATLYACWDEALIKNETISEILLVNKFFSWSPEKAKFSKEDVKDALNWMKTEGLTP